MQKTVFAGIVLLVVLGAVAAWRAQPDPKPQPLPAVTELAELIELAQAGDPKSQQRIAQSWDNFDFRSVDAVRAAARECTDQAARQRLELLADRLAAPKWRLNFEQAKAEAQKQQRLMLVFSTIGSPHGFS